jgi:hypothetical protein
LPSRVRTSIAVVLRHQPVDDHLAVAHVVFFDLRPSRTRRSCTSALRA